VGQVIKRVSINFHSKHNAMLNPLVLLYASVDVGSPMWAMHSARESAGVHDHAYMLAALIAAFAS
jgi:hypothetical protein